MRVGKKGASPNAADRSSIQPARPATKEIVLTHFVTSEDADLTTHVYTDALGEWPLLRFAQFITDLMIGELLLRAEEEAIGT